MSRRSGRSSGASRLPPCCRRGRCRPPALNSAVANPSTGRQAAHRVVPLQHRVLYECGVEVLAQLQTDGGRQASMSCAISTAQVVTCVRTHRVVLCECGAEVLAQLQTDGRRQEAGGTRVWTTVPRTQHT